RIAQTGLSGGQSKGGTKDRDKQGDGCQLDKTGADHLAVELVQVVVSVGHGDSVWTPVLPGAVRCARWRFRGEGSRLCTTAPAWRGRLPRTLRLSGQA